MYIRIHMHTYIYAYTGDLFTQEMPQNDHKDVIGCKVYTSDERRLLLVKRDVHTYVQTYIHTYILFFTHIHTCIYSNTYNIYTYIHTYMHTQASCSPRKCLKMTTRTSYAAKYTQAMNAVYYWSNVTSPWKI